MEKYIVIKEGLINSIVSDIFTFGLMFLMFWLNYTYLGNSLLIKFIIVFMLIMFSFARASKKVKRFKTKEEAIDFINS